MNFLACKNKIIFFLALLLFGFNAKAEVMLDASFAGSSPSLNTPWTATDSIDPNLNYSGWNLTWNGNGSDLTGTRPHAVDNAFGFKFCHNFGYPSTLGDALSQKHYIYFTLSPKSGSLNLNNKKIIFGVQRLNDYHAPQKYSIFTSVGGFQAGSELFTASFSSNGDYAAKTFKFIMPETGYDNITGPIEFRIYAYHTTYCWHPTSLTDFVIQDPAPLHRLSLTGTSGGTTTSEPEGVRFEEGTVVQLRATPESGYHFAGWSGDVTGKGNPRSITMRSDISVTANFAANVNDKMQVGMNLADIVDWASSEAFADAFKMFRAWSTQYPGSGFDTGKANEMPTDSYGWPRYLPFTDSNGVSQYAATILTEPLAGGVYKVLVDGTGKIRFTGAASTGSIQLNKTITEPATEIPLSVAVGNSLPLGLNILESDVNSPVRNIRIIRPDYQSLPEVPTFQARYLDLLQPFGALRFVGWGRINILNSGSPIVAWEDRTLKETYTQTRNHGVALEYMVEAANILQRDLWICVPHKADDNYVRQSARLLRDTVGPNQKIYIEYSNETWNYDPHYPQTVYVQDMGQALNLDSNRWTAGQKYVALRSVQIWKIFQEEFGADARVVRVLATHTALATNTTDLRVAAFNDPAINPDYVMPDVLAIAPYFGHNYTPGEIPPIAPSYPTLDDILNEGGTATASIAEQRSNVQHHKAIADAQGMDLVCYEAGQHFIGTAGAQNDTTLTDILIAANRDNRMHDRYADYLAMLDAEGVSTCTFLADISRPSMHGSWGVMEYLEQPLSEAPKYRALVDFITEPADLSVSSVVNPNPAYLNDALTYTLTVLNSGPSAATNVTLTNALPAGASFVSATSQGSCINDNGVVTCNLGSLASGASTMATITAMATATGTLSNTATVSGNGLDPNPANNSATATTTVVAPDLIPTTMSATKSGKTVYVSDTVQNQGDGTAGPFTVAYYLSINSTFEAGTDIALASSSSGSGTCMRSVTSLVPGVTSSVTNKVCYKPTGAVKGTQYYVLAVDDSANQVAESNETNNVRATAVRIKW